jgi:hypothetical protein
MMPAAIIATLSARCSRFALEEAAEPKQPQSMSSPRAIADAIPTAKTAEKAVMQVTPPR